MDHKNVIKVLNSFDEVNYEFDGESFKAHVIIQEYCGGGCLESISEKHGKKIHCLNHSLLYDLVDRKPQLHPQFGYLSS